MKEFDVINRFFNVENTDSSVLVGIGDDCALLKIKQHKSIVVTVDSMVENTHFCAITPVDAIAQKLVVSNISDIAANGAIPKWATLSITLPSVNESWLTTFSQALHSQLKHYGVTLIGGDTTYGKQIHLSMTLLGECQSPQYISRKGAQAGDIICVGRKLGDMALGLKIEQELSKNPEYIKQSNHQAELEYLLKRFYYPQAQVELGSLLKDYATAMIDISDGLLQDLNHMIKQANIKEPSLGYELNIDEKQLTSKQYQTAFPILYKENSINERLQTALTSGEEYILCATIPPDKLANQLNQQRLAQEGVKLYPIGKITKNNKCVLNGKSLSAMDGSLGYQHFK